MQSKTINFSPWCSLETLRVEIRVTPIGERGSMSDQRLSERATIVVESGAARLLFCPTSAEARALIAALEWALQPVEEAEAA